MLPVSDIMNKYRFIKFQKVYS